MHLVTAALLGAIQGLTEFLPISSTAHLLIAERWLDFDDPGSVFTIAIQFGSILAVMWLYRARLLEMLSPTASRESRRFPWLLLAAVIPAIVAGYLFAEKVTTLLHGSLAVIAIAFVAGGVIMLVVEGLRLPPVVMRAEQTDLGRAIGIGICQTLALIPGVSRSGATIMGGLALRLDRSAAAEFSFFLAMPTMAAAFAHDLWGARDHIDAERGLEIAVGFVMAFVAALVVVKPFLRVVARSGFAPFAWYRIVVGVAILGAMAAGWL